MILHKKCVNKFKIGISAIMIITIHPHHTCTLSSVFCLFHNSPHHHHPHKHTQVTTLQVYSVYFTTPPQTHPSHHTSSVFCLFHNSPPQTHPSHHTCQKVLFSRAFSSFSLSISSKSSGLTQLSASSASILWKQI